MYQVFLGTLNLPIAPAKIETKIYNKNETVELIDGGDINVLKSAGLTEVSFEFMIPSQNYPFSGSSLMGAVTNMLGSLGTSVNSSVILGQLEDLKVNKKPFQFIVVRTMDGSGLLGVLKSVAFSATNLKMALEDYTIIDDAENGMDLMVQVRLKQYRDYSTKILNDDGTVTRKRA